MQHGAKDVHTAQQATDHHCRDEKGPAAQPAKQLLHCVGDCDERVQIKDAGVAFQRVHGSEDGTEDLFIVRHALESEQAILGGGQSLFRLRDERNVELLQSLAVEHHSFLTVAFPSHVRNTSLRPWRPSVSSMTTGRSSRTRKLRASSTFWSP